MVKVVSKIVPHVMEISYCFERKGGQKNNVLCLSKENKLSRHMCRNCWAYL